MCGLSWNLGASTSWNPQGLSRPVQGLLYLPFICHPVCNMMSYLYYKKPCDTAEMYFSLTYWLHLWWQKFPFFICVKLLNSMEIGVLENVLTKKDTLKLILSQLNPFTTFKPLFLYTCLLVLSSFLLFMCLFPLKFPEKSFSVFIHAPCSVHPPIFLTVFGKKDRLLCSLYVTFPFSLWPFFLGGVGGLFVYIVFYIMAYCQPCRWHNILWELIGCS